MNVVFTFSIFFLNYLIFSFPLRSNRVGFLLWLNNENENVVHILFIQYANLMHFWLINLWKQWLLGWFLYWVKLPHFHDVDRILIYSWIFQLEKIRFCSVIITFLFLTFFLKFSGKVWFFLGWQWISPRDVGKFEEGYQEYQEALRCKLVFLTL